jgi:hypothetical protein
MIAFLPAIVIGIALGYTLQRGRFCTNTAIRDLLLMRDTTLLRAWALALLIQLLGVQLFVMLRLFTPDVPPFFWQANLFGGLLFGIGMVLAGGCASGTCYRVGEGMMGSLTALMGFGMAAVSTDVGALKPIQDLLRSHTILMEGEPAQLGNLFKVDNAIPIAIIAGGLLIWLLRPSIVRYQQGWPWRKTGLILGIVALVAWLSSSAVGRAYGLSVNGPLRSLFEFIISGDITLLDWGSFMLLGLVSGAFISSRLHDEAKLRIPSAGRTLQALLGGFLMGFGAQLAGGCTIGHSLTGLSVLALSSLATSVAIVLGAWITSFFLFMDGREKIKKLWQGPTLKRQTSATTNE